MSGLVNELVLSIHGVESDREWQLRVSPEFGGIHGLVHVPYSYGEFRFWKVLRKSSRQSKVDEFYEALSEFQKDHPTVRPSVIAHSFGTYVLAQTLMTYLAIDLDRVILCGSIIDRNYDWDSLLKAGRVRKIRNEVAGRDPIVGLFRYRLLRLLVPDAGPSGVDMFGKAVDGLEEQRFPQFSHSSHFVSTAHCRRYWVPFLRGTREFRDLCAACADRTNPGRTAAKAEFVSLYDPAIRWAVEFFFRDRPESALTDILNVLRESLIVEGANGQRSFAELLDVFTRALILHVPSGS